MLAATKLKLVQDLVAGATKEELIWINGYLSGITSSLQELPVAASPSKPLVNKITIAYGTETGNSKKLASVFAAEAKSKGINPKLVSLDQYRVNDIAKEEYFLAIISTQGDGEPPAAAKKFYDHIHLNGFKAEKLKYSVLALGDTSYPLFCKAGEDIDTQLNKLGGQRIAELVKCDTDYDTEAKEWFSTVLSKLTQGDAATSNVEVAAPVKKKSGKQTFAGEILASVNLNDQGSSKETYHIEIAAEEATYQPGDSIGVVPHNEEALVNAILETVGISGDQIVSYRDQQTTFSGLLKNKLNVGFLPERVVKQYATLVNQEIPVTNIGLLELLKIYSLPDNVSFEEVINILEPIAPRLYSISSSPEAHTGEIHITVAKNSFRVNDEVKYGLCSNYLASFQPGESISYYVHPNNRFRLPAENKDVIMVGPGTGIAPFRSFIAERDSTGASGRNWLFFGEQHFVTDFLYQTEIQNWVETGVLTKVNVAFSRDQQEKVYVQHKMLQQGKELFDWIESGAYIYICGTKDPMCADVENALIQIVSEHGKLSTEEAAAYVARLEEEERFLKDVY